MCLQKALHGEGRDCPGEGKCETRGGFRARQKCLLAKQGPGAGRGAASAEVYPCQPPSPPRPAHPPQHEWAVFGGRNQWGAGRVFYPGVPDQSWSESPVVRCGQPRVSSQKWVGRRWDPRSQVLLGEMPACGLKTACNNVTSQSTSHLAGQKCVAPTVIFQIIPFGETPTSSIVGPGLPIPAPRPWELGVIIHTEGKGRLREAK